MRKLGFFLLTFFIGFTLWSQAAKDSLKGKSFEELTELIQKQSQLDFEISKNIAIYQIEKAKKEGNELEEFTGLDNFIQLSIWNRKFDSFGDKYGRLLELAKRNKLDKNLMRSYYLQANAYFYQGVWSKSTESYYKSLEIAKTLNDILFQHTILTRLGYIKTTSGDYTSALKFQKDALNLLEKKSVDAIEISPANQNDMELQSNFYIALTYINSKQKDSARAYNAKGLKLNQKVADSCLMRALYKQRAEIKILYTDFENALKDLELSANFCNKSDKGDMLVRSSVYGKAYLGLKQYSKAVEVLQKGADDYNVQKSEEGFMDDHYKLLAKAYKYDGNIEKSNFYFEKYIHTTEEFNKIQDTLVSAFKQKEAEAFKKELNAITLEKDKQQNYVLYLALGATLIILTLLFFLLKFYQNKKKNDLKFQELLLKLKLTEENSATKIIDTKDEVLEETTTSDVSEEVTQQILDGLQKLESQEYFLKQDCNAYNVAKKIKTNTSYLSKVVNAHFQKNFNTYINDLRINYAIVRLKNDTRFRSFSVQSIAEELGYKSADSFTKYFKQDTGLNPSFYIKQLNQLS